MEWISSGHREKKIASAIKTCPKWERSMDDRETRDWLNEMGDGEKG
jgi:hypothetical protein